jgi:hypothetical protein
VLSGKDVNEILVVAFIGDVSIKKPRTGVSPTKVINPQPISMALPRTRETTHASQTVINITDDPEPDASAYMTLITEQAPSPPQDTTIPSQPTSLEPMQLDIPEPSENVEEPTTLTTAALSQPVSHLYPFWSLFPRQRVNNQKSHHLLQYRKFGYPESSLNGQC